MSKHMYVSSYSDENFYIDTFSIGAEAYRETFDGEIERLRVISILSTHIDDDNDVEMTTYNCNYDYDVVFNLGNVKYAVAFESDGFVDDLPNIDDITYC